ncbi:MAG: hypothetical protein WDM71_12195 [Ferruginibacter sp.]
MQELINDLIAKANLTPEQATQAIDIIKDFVKQKFPMFEGMIDNLFAQNNSTSSGDPLDNIKDSLGGFFK